MTVVRRELPANRIQHPFDGMSLSADRIGYSIRLDDSACALTAGKDAVNGFAMIDAFGMVAVDGWLRDGSELAGSPERTMIQSQGTKGGHA